MNPAIKRNILFALLFYASILVFAAASIAETTQNIDATVKLGICGNDLAEDNEDCDNADLKGKTCETLGYASGTLSCYASCDFNITLCIPKVVLNDDRDSDNGGGGDNNPHSDTNTTSITTKEALTYTVPEVIRLFDTNGDGKLTLEELYGITKRWFDVWESALADQTKTAGKEPLVTNRKTLTCDLNKDGVCSLVDFSVLMYYVDR